MKKIDSGTLSGSAWCSTCYSAWDSARVLPITIKGELVMMCPQCRWLKLEETHLKRPPVEPGYKGAKTG